MGLNLTQSTVNMTLGSLLLASGSPRRRVLLADAGFNVKVLRGREVAEEHPEDMEVEKVPEYLSRLKATTYADVAQSEGLPLVAGDTIVILDGHEIGKPADEAEARDILRRLNGRWHEVVSGVSLMLPRSGEMLSFSEKTRVKFAMLPRELIDRYVEVYKPLDKAGAYGIQEWIGLVGVERIEGDFYNIMGFPVRRFVELYLSACPVSQRALHGEEPL